MTPSGSARSSARSIDASAPPRSPSRSRARAASSDASIAAHARLGGSLPALDDGAEDVDGPLRIAFGQVEGGLGDAYACHVVLLAGHLGKRGPRRVEVAAPGLHLHDPAAPLAAEDVLLHEQRLHVLRDLEGRERIVEVASRHGQQSRGVVDHQLGSGLAVRPDRAARLLQPALGLVEAPEPEQDHRPRAQARPR